ncbi:HAD family phosphatase [Anaerococcus sp. Marseille-P3625]|uniref:HAD family hydrolase n=1 Tax=Anaerococcus sp. Marseille-P3625 TaxID=1977277 RepID=UPI000C07EB24|nr:HAD-IA family hydrolase [Anaerococcus sp. Marseille-P3625]
MKLLFDCDGTLLDSMHIWVEPINKIFNKYGYSFEGLEKKEKGVIEALPLSGMVTYIAKNIAKDMTEEEVNNYFLEIVEDGYKNHLMPKDGVLEKLKDFYDHDIEMGIASSTDSKYLKLAFNRLGIDHYFTYYNTPDLLNSKKSDAKFWQSAIDNFKIDPEEIMLFDDALYAIKAANKSGIKTCGVRDFPYNKNEWEDIKKFSDIYLEGIWDFDINTLLK